MKVGSKLAVIGGILIAAVVVYAAVGPFFTIHQIKTGIEQQDSEKLSENIDFPMLRSNLKDQIGAMMMKQAAAESKDNPFGALGIMFASKMVESAVDSMITPSGLQNLMTGAPPTRPQEAGQPSQQSDQSAKADPFRNVRYTFDTQSKFSIWVKRPDLDETKEVRFVLTRDGLSWKLSNIVIPPT